MKLFFEKGNHLCHSSSVIRMSVIKNIGLYDMAYRQLYVPRGFAHGFISLEDNTIFQYLIDKDDAPDMEGGILWNDPELGIDWDGMFKENGIDEPLTSEKDAKHLTLSKSPKYFRYK